MSKINLGLGITFLIIALVLVSQANHVFAATSPTARNAVMLNSPAAQGCSGTPTVQYAYANPASIYPGQVTTLYWGLVGNASAAFLVYPNGNTVGIGTPGSQQVNPTTTRTYFIRAVCGSNTVNVPITVTVQNGPGCSGTPQITSFTANPTTVNNGQSATVSWGAVNNADNVQFSSSTQGGSGVPTPGSVQVTPHQTTTYYLTAWCQGVSAQAQVTVNVNNAPPPTPVPPANANQVRQVQLANQNNGQIKVTVNYFWNGEDAPAQIVSYGYNSNRALITNTPSTAIIAGFVKYVIQYLQPNLGGGNVSTVTSCIIGSSGTELACLSVPR